MLAEATANYTAVEKRAAEAEENLRRLQLRSLESERAVRSQWDRPAANQEAAERDHRRIEQTLRVEIQDLKDICRAASAQLEAEGLDRAEIESRLRQEIAEKKSRRQPSPDILQNAESL